MDFTQPLFQEEEHTLQSFVERVFATEPQPANTYSLSLDTEYTNTPEDLKTAFEALATVFTLAMKKKHSNPSTGQVDLTSVTEQQFEQMQEYFKSFGFNVYYSATPFTQFNPDQNYNDDDDLPSLDDISTATSPATQPQSASSPSQTSHNLDDLPSSEGDKLEDFFLTLKTEYVKYKVWFSFLQNS